ncbi:MAG TPA: alpha/beta hydrolase family protein [Candidatus Acidoferrales bacterium]|nr:alpha/beta hydrolase family protein [Candidatus Acidoferrales bacterium]
MPGIYARWMDRWERKLATRDTNRVVLPFEWGTEWLAGIGFPEFPVHVNGNSAECVEGFVSAALADSARFFAYEPVRDYRIEGGELTFTSPVHTAYAGNNTARALWFPAEKDGGRALVVLPQWNSGPDGHVGLAKLLNRFGISALRMTMAYHAERRPPETQRADFHCSSNIGRTIHASRQSVIDVRACLDWLTQQGYGRLGILGTSLGSCVAFIAAAHDARVRMGIFNHVSMYFSDVVWTGLSTQNVREGFGDRVTQDDLRRYWSVISPASYLKRMKGRDLKSLLVWASHDSTFLPVYSQQVLESFHQLELPHEVFNLPCGHYTTGQFPFNLMDGLAMCRFAARAL